MCQVSTEKRNKWYLCALRTVNPILRSKVTLLSNDFSPAQSGIQDWKSRISVRSLRDPLHLRPLPTEPSLAASLTPFLCYACHTTLTSRSSRGTTATGSISTEHSSVPLPRWVFSNLQTSLEMTEDGERWTRTKMSDDGMKATVADFLFDE